MVHEARMQGYSYLFILDLGDHNVRRCKCGKSFISRKYGRSIGKVFSSRSCLAQLKKDGVNTQG